VTATQKPAWLKVRLPSHGDFFRVAEILKAGGLHTICQSARCPNIGECWERRTATFLILGDTCTRNCGFCAVAKGTPAAPDPDDAAALETVLAARPDILNHNLETTESLYPAIRRPKENYRRSLGVLAAAKARGALTKSGLMIGLGESETDILRTLADLRQAGCDLLTVGQYLQPTAAHPPVAKYYTPEEFEALGAAARRAGFLEVVSGPLVRSSYEAGRLYETVTHKDEHPCAT
jgi:lipoic acid synthetase